MSYCYAIFTVRMTLLCSPHQKCFAHVTLVDGVITVTHSLLSHVYSIQLGKTTTLTTAHTKM